MEFHPETLPTSEQIREDLADRIYHPYKKQIWAAGIVLTIVVVGFLAFREMKRAELDNSWAALAQASEAEIEPDDGKGKPRAELLEEVRQAHAGKPVAAYALADLVRTNIATEDFEQALVNLDQLRNEARTFPLNTESISVPAGSPAQPLSQILEDSLRREIEWRQQTAYQHRWPAEDRMALVETNIGSFWMGFYGEPGEAPDHVAAIIEHAKNGGYNQTQFDEVRRTRTDNAPQFLQFGNTLSKDWTNPRVHSDDNPRETLQPEDSRFAIKHQYRVVSAVRERSGESRTRLMIVTAKDGMNRFDGTNTPVGAVMPRDDSLATLDTLALSRTYATNADTKGNAEAATIANHPYPYVYVRRMSIHGPDGLERGHTWDTSRVGTADPEPWEADLPAAWRPEDPKKDDAENTDDEDDSDNSTQDDDEKKDDKENE